MERVTIEKILAYAKEHPECTVEDVQRMLYPDASQYEGQILVRLYYQCYGSENWEEYILLDSEEYDVLNSANPTVKLGDIEGKHSDVHSRWREIAEEIYEDPMEIARVVKAESYDTAYDLFGGVLQETINSWNELYCESYISGLLDRWTAKPDLSYDFEEAKFLDKDVMQLVNDLQLEMDDRGLGCSPILYDRWNRRMIQMADERWGGHTPALDIEEEIV